MMSEKEISELLNKYQSGNISEVDKDKLEAWYLHKAASNNKRLTEFELEESREYLASKLPLQQKGKVKSLWARISVAASILVFFSAGISYFTEDTSGDVQVVEEAREFAPGGNRGVLTLSNGQQIVLTDASGTDTIAKEGQKDEITILRNQNGIITYQIDPSLKATKELTVSYNTLSTPVGGQFNLTLADGTKVYLNAVSSITYPTQFDGEQRMVELHGEAYFEVAEDREKPFIVRSGEHHVEVHGTHFNVHAYEDEPGVKTTLLEGSVSVSYKDQRVFLEPGQQSSVGDNLEEIQIKEVDADVAIAWKNGRFKFDNADLKTIMKQLERWYGIKVEYQGAVSDKEFVGGTFMNKNLSQVLRVLELNNIEFSVEGKTVIVKP